ncbi:hypothetical protein [Actinoplanes subtropicus]|uniref:hypothetical protein n=1 Tax=Actinoplanes subtropicus TaxID=543632 RepID=UPI0004C370AF|nr:hypothetical protein [Actinoplanes subtropicus]
MTRTSPARPLDLKALFPGIGAFARTATRLHPRPGEPGPFDSHVGGPLLWPADEPWPSCDQPHSVETRTPVPPELAGRLRNPTAQVMRALHAAAPGFCGVSTTEEGTFLLARTMAEQPGPLVPVAQLRAADVPDLRCPPGTDMLQVLWCPNVHYVGADYAGPAIQLRWRAAADVLDVLPTPPPVAVSEEDFRPRRCVLHPEQVVEYPWWQELPEDLGAQVEAFEDSRQFGAESYSSVSQAPGWKVGGYAQWGASDLDPMLCAGCHAPTDLLLTIGETEGRPGAWLPVEDAHLEPSRINPEWLAATEPTGVHTARNYGLRIFMCRACPGGPIRLNSQ